jgi:hypothetical protein
VVLDNSPRQEPRGNPQGRTRRSTTRAALAAGSAMALGAALLMSTGTAQGLNTARTGPADARGFPEYYTDDSGISLDLCEDGTANCLLAVEADLVPPDGEGFYWMATATLASSRGTIDVEFALEAAFGELGEPEVFDRLRVRGDLNRAGTYTLQHPYGSTRLLAENPAQPRNVNFTEDLLCNLPSGACGGHIDSWLRSVNEQVGYLGRGELASRVTGGTARNSLVLRAPNGRVIGRTSQIAILGKLAPGPQAAMSRTAVDFGNTLRRRTRSVVIDNLGDAPLTFAGIRVVGSRAFSVARTGCAARAQIPSGGQCAVNLRYRPRTRQAAARLVVDDNTIAGLHRLRLTGRSTSVLSAPRRVRFAGTQVGSQTGTRRVVVENSGVRRLRIRGVSLSGGQQRSFERRTGPGPRCRPGATLRPRGACAIYVGFAPKSFGVKRSSIRIRSNALTNPDQVALVGRGR